MSNVDQASRTSFRVRGCGEAQPSTQVEIVYYTCDDLIGKGELFEGLRLLDFG
jgi:hypothetical protein